MTYCLHTVLTVVPSVVNLIVHVVIAKLEAKSFAVPDEAVVAELRKSVDYMGPDQDEPAVAAVAAKVECKEEELDDFSGDGVLGDGSIVDAAPPVAPLVTPSRPRPWLRPLRNRLEKLLLSRRWLLPSLRLVKLPCRLWLRPLRTRLEELLLSRAWLLP